MKIRKFTVGALILSGMLISVFGEPLIKYNGFGNIILAQDDTDAGSPPETQGSTPRIKSKKRAEYSEGKSPLIAAGMSLLVPGAGEYYGRDYIRSGIFFGIEALTLSMWYYYESDGDDRRDEYREYADLNFDEELYYGGLLGMTQNVKFWLESKNSMDAGEEFNAADYWNYEYFSNRDNWSWEEDDSLAVFDMLELSFKDMPNGWNGVEISLDGGSSQFTHNLPETKTQQYYEMIGKYHQFACGWNDFTGYEYNPDGSVVMLTDSIMSSDGTYVEVMRPKFKDNDSDPSNNIIFDYSDDGYNSLAYVDFYEDLRDETNQAYEMGSNFLMITLLNHVASAFDASYVIKSKYHIDTQLRIENTDKADKIGLDNYKITYSVNW
ncbi:TPA: hypothetical protein DCR49_02305 [Candidatus Delongbacteria bacterium]|nr:MAG: hypothetical protein A2Y39_03190 [Candidatus Delongbacteria bacterium GWF2_40_14]HAQ60826.1 hypothetical protein [Candidatus Delongbacteria bacterium]